MAETSSRSQRRFCVGGLDGRGERQDIRLGPPAVKVTHFGQPDQGGHLFAGALDQLPRRPPLGMDGGRDSRIHRGPRPWRRAPPAAAGRSHSSRDKSGPS
jgi:hypothetical protein